MADIVSSAVFDSLLDAIIAKLEAISTVDSVIVGTFGDVVLCQKEAGEFPCIEIIPGKNSGENYVNQRDQQVTYDFDILAHTYAESVDRISGNDIKTLNHLGATIIKEIYGFHDDTEDPCSGFIMVSPQYINQPFYKENAQNINTCFIQISVIVHKADTTA